MTRSTTRGDAKGAPRRRGNNSEGEGGGRLKILRPALERISAGVRMLTYLPNLRFWKENLSSNAISKAALEAQLEATPQTQSSSMRSRALEIGAARPISRMEVWAK